MMTECLDDILELGDEDSDTLETLEQSDDDLDQTEDLHVEAEVETSQEQRLTKTEVEVEAIRVSLAGILETIEMEERAREAHQADCLPTANIPARLDLLKHHLIEEFETVCQNEKALVFLLCGQTKIYIKNL